MTDNPLVDLLENILLVPSSDFYIATILHDPAGQSLDPRTIDLLDLGTLTVEGIAIGVQIRNLSLSGFSNVQVAFDGQGNPEIAVEGDTVTFHALLPNTQPGYQRPADVPAQAQANGDLLLSIAGTPMPPGRIAMTVSAVQDLTGVFTATQGAGGVSTATVTFTDLSLALDLAAGALTVSVELDSVFTPTINAMLATPATQQQIIDQVNEQLSGAAVLEPLSGFATQQARAALAGA